MWAIAGRVLTSTYCQLTKSFVYYYWYYYYYRAITYPMNVSASKFEAWSRFSSGSSGIDKASVDATFDSDVGGAAI